MNDSVFLELYVIYYRGTNKRIMGHVYYTVIIWEALWIYVISLDTTLGKLSTFYKQGNQDSESLVTCAELPSY